MPDRLVSRLAGRDPRLAELYLALPEGREHAASVRELAGWLEGNPAPSVVRDRIHRLQADGVAVLSSPRAGVWLAADDGEILDVVDEMRATVAAIERRIATINGGKCALRTCRAELPDKVKRRRGLYCRPRHRFLAAANRREDP